MAPCCGSLAEQTASSRPEEEEEEEEEEGLRVECNPINPPDRVERTDLVVVLVLATAPVSRQGLRMHSRPLNPPCQVERTGLVVALVLTTAPGLAQRAQVAQQAA